MATDEDQDDHEPRAQVETLLRNVNLQMGHLVELAKHVAERGARITRMPPPKRTKKKP